MLVQKGNIITGVNLQIRWYVNLSGCCYVASVVSDSVRPQRWQPTRLLCPWDSPGKNTGVGCHFLLQCMKSESEVAQSCPTLRDPMDCSLPGSSIHGIFPGKSTGVGCHCLLRIYRGSMLAMQLPTQRCPRWSQEHSPQTEVH